MIHRRIYMISRFEFEELGPNKCRIKFFSGQDWHKSIWIIQGAIKKYAMVSNFLIFTRPYLIFIFFRTKKLNMEKLFPLFFLNFKNIISYILSLRPFS